MLPAREIWCVDFEFQANAGERPTPLCMVAREYHTGRLIRTWADQFDKSAPFSVGADALFVAYYASAEIGCFLALGWKLPERVLDLYVEFKCMTSGILLPQGKGVLGALSYYGLTAIDQTRKDEMRALALRGGTYSVEERQVLLDYCQSDVDALIDLLPVMDRHSHVDLPRALLRGRYMAAVARMEWTGVPIDTTTLADLRANWEGLKSRLIGEIDKDYGIYAGGTFSASRWEHWLIRHGIDWPRLDSGKLALDEDTFREAAKLHPQVRPIADLRATLSSLRLEKLAVGPDGRNRCLLSPFASKTGRNQPSTTEFIFGPAVWLRNLIQPAEGRALAYIDYEQQEFGIAASLSGDAAMSAAYASGDPYLTFGKQAGRVPASGTKATHSVVRDQFKLCALGVQYCMQAESLARQMGDSKLAATRLLELHQNVYSTYWDWSDAVQNQAVLTGALQSRFGWRVHVTAEVNGRSLRNFPLQANGADMIRIVCCRLTEHGISVCAPVHDAVLIEADASDIEQAVETTQRVMREASEVVLDGFSLRTEAKVIQHPARYSDPRGKDMWNRVATLLAAIKSERPVGGV